MQPRIRRRGRRLDVAGAIIITLSLMLAIYGIVNGNEAGWTSARTFGCIGGGAVLFALFIAVEAKVRTPLMPLGLFRFRNLSGASVIGALWSAAMFAWFFVSALYMQLVLGYSALQVGLAFLPANLIMAGFSLGLSARIVMRFGNRLPLALGLRSPRSASRSSPSRRSRAFPAARAARDAVLGIGCGMALNPILLVAMGEVAPGESGLASGVVNTAFMMGGSLGLAVLASLSAARTESLLAAGAACQCARRRLPARVRLRRGLRGHRRADRRVAASRQLPPRKENAMQTLRLGDRRRSAP